mmetsp:Transcript_18112/g.37733  ORF Transcript_18112/g.37733 Transcript_18112/m.37733 type:complete len:97 (+) Transcript_18112:1-291(+)
MAGTEMGQWTMKEKFRMMLDISYGMEYLHNKRIVHQDLKSLNILLDKNGKGKVADFGKSKSNGLQSQLSNMSKKNTANTTTSVGTYAWCAPEVILG